MTLNDFINREIATWGEDVIFDLLDRGFEAVELHDGMGHTKWTWRYVGLTNASKSATMTHGGYRGLLPFSLIPRT